MKKVAFICVHNSCRSQIAEALGKLYGADVFESYSAGTETKPQINQDAVRLMKKIYGIDMEKIQKSKLLENIPSYCSAKVLSKYSDDDLELFFEMTRNGDKKYLEILEKYLEYLSITITNLRMIFDCDIVIGGYIGGFLDEYRLQLDKSITKYNNFDMDTSYIYTGKYKKEASAIGIAMKFIDRFFYELI